MAVTPDRSQIGVLRVLCLLPILLFTGGLLLYPLATLLVSGFQISQFSSLLEEPIFLRIVGFTYFQAAISALLSAIVGTWGAFIYAEQEFCWKKVLWKGSLLGFSLPTILVILGLVSCYGRNGIYNAFLGALGLAPFEQLYGWVGILLAHLFFNYPLFLKRVGIRLIEMDRSEERVALSLGASRFYCLFWITLRKILPSLAQAYLLSFLFCSASFLVILILGGGPRFTSLEVAIYESVKIDFDLGQAVGLAIVQLIISSLLYSIVRILENLGNTPLKRAQSPVPLYLFQNPLRNLLLRSLFALCLFIIALAPLLSLVADGVPSLFKLECEVWQALLASISLGSLVSIASVLIGFLLAYSEKHFSNARILTETLKYVSMIPVSISTILLSVSYLIAYPTMVHLLRGNLFPIVIIQSVMALPLTVGPLRDGFSQIHDSLYRSASSLGAPVRTVLLSLELPLLRKSIGLAALMAFSFSLAEIGAVAVLLPEGISTLPLLIFRLMNRYQFDLAYGVGLLLLAVMLVISWLTEKCEQSLGKS